MLSGFAVGVLVSWIQWKLAGRMSPKVDHQIPIASCLTCSKMPAA